MLRKASIIVSFLMTVFLIDATGQIVDPIVINDFDSTLLAPECKLDKEQLGKIFTKLEMFAEFPGGVQKWFDFANDNFDFAYVLSHISDTVQFFQDSIIVRFTVARSGTVCNMTIRAGNAILSPPTFKLLKSSPNWKPGTSAGRQLNSYRTLRLDILIDKKENRMIIKRNAKSYFRDNS